MRRHRLAKISSAKLDAFIQQYFENDSHFLTAALVGRSTLNRMRADKPVLQKTVYGLVARLAAKGIPITAAELMDEGPVKASSVELASAWQQEEWEVIPSSMTLPVVMSNGLVMQVAKARHRLIDNEFGRMKVYDIRGLAREMRLRYRDALTRHAAVCRKLIECRQISTNITMVAQSDFQLWAVVDRWVEGVSLSDHIKVRPPNLEDVLAIAKEIAQGINALHGIGVVGREIRPESIIVSHDMRQCTLTDLELAKLLDSEATVSAHWVPNPFRAPEITKKAYHPQADLYSLAKIAVFMLTGTPQKYPDDCEALRSSALPTAVTTYLSGALSPRWKERPESIAELLVLLDAE